MATPTLQEFEAWFIKASAQYADESDGNTLVLFSDGREIFLADESDIDDPLDSSDSLLGIMTSWSAHKLFTSISNDTRR